MHLSIVENALSLYRKTHLKLMAEPMHSAHLQSSDWVGALTQLPSFQVNKVFYVRQPSSVLHCLTVRVYRSLSIWQTHTPGKWSACHIGGYLRNPHQTWDEYACPQSDLNLQSQLKVLKGLLLRQHDHWDWQTKELLWDKSSRTWLDKLLIISQTKDNSVTEENKK
jgi:hypothetical protein